MTRRFDILLVALVVLPLSACASTRPAEEVASVDPVDQLVQKNTEARGGLEAIRAIQSAVMTGTVETEGMSMPLTVRTKRPGMLHSEVVVEAMGMEFVSGYDGNVAWELNPMLGSRARALEGSRKRTMAGQADLDGELIDYRSKGLDLELVGKTLLDSTEVYEIKMTLLEDSTVSTVYLDADTYLTVRVDGEGVNPQTGRPTTVQTSVGDYRQAGGVLWPHTMNIRMRGASPQTVHFESVEVNVPIPDSLFAFPGS